MNERSSRNASENIGTMIHAARGNDLEVIDIYHDLAALSELLARMPQALDQLEQAIVTKADRQQLRHDLAGEPSMSPPSLEHVELLDATVALYSISLASARSVLQPTAECVAEAHRLVGHLGEPRLVVVQ